MKYPWLKSVALILGEHQQREQRENTMRLRKCEPVCLLWLPHGEERILKINQQILELKVAVSKSVSLEERPEAE
jgi:hypothetical protein